MTLSERIDAGAQTTLPTAGRVMQAALADAMLKWIADNAPEELLEQTPDRFEAARQRNDRDRKMMAAE
jgi:hypothetical protein